MASSKFNNNSERHLEFSPSESSHNSKHDQKQLESLLSLLLELGILDSGLKVNSQAVLNECEPTRESSLGSQKLVKGRKSFQRELEKKSDRQKPFLSTEKKEIESTPVKPESTVSKTTNLSSDSADIDLIWSTLQGLLFYPDRQKALVTSGEKVGETDDLERVDDPKSQTVQSRLESESFESETVPKRERGKLADVEAKTKVGRLNYLDFEWQKPTREGELEKNNQSETQGKLESEKEKTELVKNLEAKVQEKITPAVVERGKVLTTDSAELAKMHQTIINLEAKLSKLENQVYEPTELINPLIPLMTELLKMRVNESREIMIETLTPVVDELIQERGLHNLRGMSGVLAEILPEAITHEVERQPEAIARALAPEIAIAIREQIKLQEGAIAKTLGPEMGRAIKAQIAHERDAMVDALYPVIGNTVSKYMAEVVQSINQKVESALSPEGVGRKMRATFQGVSEAELILRESLGFAVQAIFLIHKTSGLLIKELQPIKTLKLEGDMLAGMLTAIRSFVYDCIVQNGEVSELTEIEYGNSKIIIEVAGYCYLAVVIDGEPSKKFIKKMRATLSKIIGEYDREVQEFDGDPATIPEAIEEFLRELVKVDKKTEEENQKKPLLGFFKLGLLLLLLLGIPGGYFQYRSWVAHRIETKTAIALDATPELSVYRLLPEVKRDKLILKGRVPSESLRSLAGEVSSEIAPDLDLNNQIIAVDVPPDRDSIIAELQRVTSLLNQREGIEIFARYEADKVIVNGNVANISDVPKVTQAFEQVPGVRSVVNIFQLGEPLLKERIYFDSGSTILNQEEFKSKLLLIGELLKQNPQVNLKIIGHTDRQGTKEQNQELALKRAKIVRDAFQKQGVEATRLEIFGNPERPSDIPANQPLRLSRVVRFEPYINTPEE